MAFVDTDRNVLVIVGDCLANVGDCKLQSAIRGGNDMHDMPNGDSVGGHYKKTWRKCGGCDDIYNLD